MILPETQILIPNNSDINSLTAQELQSYINDRIKLNIDHAIDSVNEWNKEHGFNSETITSDKVKFEKDNSKPVLYSVKNSTQQEEVNVSTKYGNSNLVQTNITLKKI